MKNKRKRNELAQDIHHTSLMLRTAVNNRNLNAEERLIYTLENIIKQYKKVMNNE